MTSTQPHYPRLWPPLAVLGLGFVTGIVGIIMLVSGVATNVVGAINAQRQFTTGTTITYQASPGSYYIYQQVANAAAAANSNTLGTQIIPSEVHITGPEGNPVAVTAADGSEFITINNDGYVNVVGFHPGRTGQYTISVDTPPGDSPDNLAVSASLGNIGTGVAKSAIGGGITMGVGALLFFVGVVLLIVSLVRRSSWRKRYAPKPAFGGPAYPQAQMYPQPQAYPTYPQNAPPPPTPPGYSPPPPPPPAP